MSGEAILFEYTGINDIMGYEDYDKPIHRKPRPTMTDEDKQQITDYLTEHTPKGAGIVVVIITSEGTSTFTNMSMPEPEDTVMIGTKDDNPTAGN